MYDKQKTLCTWYAYQVPGTYVVIGTGTSTRYVQEGVQELGMVPTYVGQYDKQNAGLPRMLVGWSPSDKKVTKVSLHQPSVGRSIEPNPTNPPTHQHYYPRILLVGAKTNE
jgi:hypothetical protein